MVSAAAALHVEGERLRVPASAFEHAGFRRWVTSLDFPSDIRATFVRGEVFIEMSPEAIESHNKVKTEVTSELHRLVKADDLGEVYGDRTLLTHVAAGLSTEPDVTFARWSTLESGRLRRVPKANRGDDYVELEGAPDVVIEIVSDSSAQKDLERLRVAYARAGIPEYWIIDARGDQLRFEILTRRGAKYAAKSAVGRAQRSPTFGCAFTLARRRNRIGAWRYDLSTIAR
jgi:Uma2 family endonuclease